MRQSTVACLYGIYENDPHHASCCGTNMTTVLKGVECFQRTGAREGTAREAVNWSWPKTEAACLKKKSHVQVRQNILTVVQKKRTFTCIVCSGKLNKEGIKIY